MPLSYKTNYNQIVEHLKKELMQLRTARATPSLLENILIQVYGQSRMPIKELATISIPTPRTIVIKPWDKSIIKEIEKGLIKSELEFNPIVETDILRIQLPELTQETRQKLVKRLHHLLEEQRIKLRAVRDDAKKEIERQERAGEMTKDDKYDEVEKLNTVTREYTKEIDELGKKKEEEIMTI